MWAHAVREQEQLVVFADWNDLPRGFGNIIFLDDD